LSEVRWRFQLQSSLRDIEEVVGRNSGDSQFDGHAHFSNAMPVSLLTGPVRHAAI
jgi:hypothetical protein